MALFAVPLRLATSVEYLLPTLELFTTPKIKSNHRATSLVHPKRRAVGASRKNFVEAKLHTADSILNDRSKIIPQLLLEYKREANVN